jgi:putative salt-induced outer membrane protein
MRNIILISIISVLLTASFAYSQDLPKWAGTGSAGYVQTSGNTDSAAANGNLEFLREGYITDMTWKAGLNYGYTKYTTKKIVSTDNYFALYKLDRYLSEDKRLYGFVQPQFQSDEFQGYWGKYMVDLGVGYNWIPPNHQKLKTEAGYSFIDWNYIKPDEDGHEWKDTHNALARLIYSNNLREWLQVGQEALYYVNVEESDDYHIESFTYGNFKLSDRLSYKVSLTVKYNNKTQLIERKDKYGSTATDTSGDPILNRADHTDIIWANALVFSFF